MSNKPFEKLNGIPIFSVDGDPESTKVRHAEESDDFLYASLLFHEINAEHLSDEDNEPTGEKVDENCAKVCNGYL